MNKTAFLAAVVGFLTTPLFAQQVKKDAAKEPPPINLKLTEEAAEAAFRPRFNLGSDFTLTPIVRGGLLAPFGGLPVPYSILQPSPFGVVGLNARYSGALESLVMATVGYTELQSHKGISDPKGAAASPASSLPAQTHFSQPTVVGSAYADLGKVVSLAPAVKAAFFAAADTFGMNSLRSAPGSYGGVGMAEGNTGALVMYKDGQNEASAFADLRVEGAAQNMFRNGDYGAVPAGTVGAEYARTTLGGHRLAAGVEATTQRADLGLRPYMEWSHDKVSALVAGNLRQSRNAFYPDTTGAGAEVRVEVARGVQLGILGDVSREKYSMAPAPQTSYGMMATFNISLDKIFGSEAAVRVRQRQEERRTQAQDSYEMNDRLPDGKYDALFKTALTQSPTFADFVKRIPGKSVDDILSAVSAFTATFGDKNFNSNEGTVANSNNIDDIYQRGRASFLNGKDDPMLVCIGSAQFAAVLAEAMGRQAGIPIQAMASHVEVPDKNGQQGGHAVAAVKTEKYGIVFVDWGKLTPTYTFDTKQAFRVYQALQGIPSIYHTVTAGEDGHHVGYLFTDEGKAIVNNLTFHDDVAKPPLGRLFNDDPRGDALTIERFKQLTRGKF